MFYARMQPTYTYRLRARNGGCFGSNGKSWIGATGARGLSIGLMGGLEPALLNARSIFFLIEFFT